MPDQPQGDPPPQRVPDPGSPSAATLAGIIGLGLFLLIAASQNLPVFLGSGNQDSEADQRVVAPGPTNPQLYSARLLYGIADLFGEDTRTLARSDILIDLEDSENMSDVERFRNAILVADLQDLDDAAAIFDELAGVGEADALPRSDEGAEQQPVPDAIDEERNTTIAEDARLTLEIINRGINAISDEEREGLIERHGLLGKVAISLGRSETATEYKEVIDESRRTTIATFVYVGWQLSLALLGIALLIVGIVLVAGKRLRRRLDAPAPGGSVYLEMFPLFLGLFVFVQVIPFVVTIPSAYAPAVQWITALVVVWPMLRRVDWSRARQDLGIHSGEGVVKEMLCGVLAYAATIPVFWVASVLGLGLQMLTGVDRPDVVGDRLSETNSVMPLVVLASLVVLWAPLVEETVFRGALHRHLRGRLGMWSAVFLGGLVFALIHSYGPSGLPALLVLGMSFALMREWRGSLIAPITAHFIHNSAQFAFLTSQSL